MAAEITVSCSLSFSKGSSSAALSGSGAFTMTGTRYLRGRQNIGTTEEQISIGEITSEGWMLVINRDTSNFVRLRQGVVASYSNALIKIKPGEFALFRVDPAATLYGTADTAAVDVEYLLIED
jgi:hypothetical protein